MIAIVTAEVDMGKIVQSSQEELGDGERKYMVRSIRDYVWSLEWDEGVTGG